ncbi:hypothetical protein PWY36_29775 [Kribbella solani]|nr:hypothetical protein [Kribbella solani]MDX2973399.1 hypothetical protein [Kribbella solani]
MGLDEVFDHVGRDGALVAAVLEALTAETEHVLVELALMIAGDGEAEWFAAAGAEDRALQVVDVDARLLTALNTSIANILYSLEQGLIDEARVASLELDPVEPDVADVVPVSQHGVDLGFGDRLGRLLRSGQRRDATGLEVFVEHRLGPVTSGVALEALLDDDGALSVDLDGSDLVTFVVPLADVEVAKGRHTGRAARLCLLEHAFTRLVGQILGVELCDRAHDAVHQHAAWRLVDVLRRRDELHTGGLQGKVDLDVVGSVAGKAVDLVHDDVVNMVLTDVFEHQLQLRTLRGASALSGVDELLDNNGVEALGFAGVYLALSGDREPLCLATARRLLLGAHAEVEHRCLLRGRAERARGRDASGHEQAP